jgi:hypothetical protein
MARGIGITEAFVQHAVSFIISMVLAIGVVVCAMQDNKFWRFGAIILYVIYCAHAFTTTLFAALSNNAHTASEAKQILAIPKKEDPRFHWEIKCYHYETVWHTVTETKDGESKTRWESRQERVDTHRAQHSGSIPSTDLTCSCLPDEMAQMTEIVTSLDLDFSSSNYLLSFDAWAAHHKQDVYAEESHSENLPSRETSILVGDGGEQPWWMGGGWYALSTIFLLCSLYSLAVQSCLGQQGSYTYKKKCHNIEEIRHPYRMW